MEDRILIAKRVAQELRNGNLVNLGIGIPSLVADYLPSGIEVYFQSENGVIGVSSVPGKGLEDEYLTDAGGVFIGALPGACSLDSCTSFSLIRGGHLDVTVLGGLQIDEEGLLANWMVPDKIIPGMGGGMDLATGAKRVIVAMFHSEKGISKIVRKCILPITSTRRVDLIVTDLAVIEPTNDGLVLKETAPDVTVDQVIAATAAKLIVPGNVPEMPII
ncbi:MAG: 3-oxoacid CoA-transferase subunit B [Bdellovibrionales bacterium]|jgi:acetate CoA/acetoacetate CoA-transferase beta subunit